MQTKILKLIGFALLFVGVMALAGISYQRIPLGSTDFNRLESGITNSSSSVGVGDTTVLAAGAVTSYAKLSNDGAGIVYCFIGATSSLNAGIRLGPVGLTTSSQPTFHVFDHTNLPVQAIRCIATATSTVTIYAK